MLFRQFLVWSAAMLFLVGICLLMGSDSIWAFVLLGLASGVVSFVALLPGVILGAPTSGLANRAGVFMVACAAAMALRVMGTVALFVVCRYQMGLSLETLAIHVCSWYAFLTAIQVRLLAKSAAAFDTIEGNQLALQPAGFANTETVLERLSTERNQ